MRGTLLQEMGSSPLSRFADACLEGSGPERPWFERIAAASLRIFEQGRGAGAALMVLSPDGARRDRVGAVGATVPLATCDWLTLTSDVDVKPAVQPFTATLLSRVFKRRTMRDHPWWNRALELGGSSEWADCIGVGFYGSYGAGVLCSLLSDRGWDPARWRDVRVIRRHLISTVHARLSCCGPEDADAVLAPEGEIRHARSSPDAHTRALLTEAVRALERTRRGADSQAEGDRIWRELHAGGWSAVDHVESDGKRHLLLVRAGAFPELALDATESMALDLVRTGRSNTQIAIELRISDPAVSALVRGALRKLRFRSRVEYLRHIADRGRSRS